LDKKLSHHLNRRILKLKTKLSLINFTVKSQNLLPKSWINLKINSLFLAVCSGVIKQRPSRLSLKFQNLRRIKNLIKIKILQKMKRLSQNLRMRKNLKAN
jgi:hypothetical protein